MLISMKTYACLWRAILAYQTQLLGQLIQTLILSLDDAVLACYETKQSS